MHGPSMRRQTHDVTRSSGMREARRSMPRRTNQLLASLAKLRSLAVAAVVKRGGRRMAAVLKTISIPVPWAAALLLILLGATAAQAQENTAEEAARRQAVLATLPPDAARRVFGLTATPAPGPAQPIGSYTKGCMAGAVEMPADGPNWQVMRPSRNRAWGQPALIAFLTRLAGGGPNVGWPGLLIGDLAQPLGGPML